VATDHRARYELIGWALTTKVPTNRRVGRASLHRLLAMLVLHSNGDQTTFVGRSVLAEELDMDERDIWHGLRALAGAGLIATDGKRGRAIRWRVRPGIFGLDEDLDPELPAGISPQSTAGIPRGELRGELRGIRGDFPHPHSVVSSEQGTGEQRARERAPEQSPAPHCRRHPQGTDLACAACATAREHYTQWRRTSLCSRDQCGEPIDPNPTHAKYRLCSRHLQLRARGQ
jgi:hypothetical protein